MDHTKRVGIKAWKHTHTHRLAGSYEVIVGGLTGDALVDFTGGVNEVIELRKGGYSRDDGKMAELFEVKRRGKGREAGEEEREREE